jgi:hypothetical protein
MYRKIADLLSVDRHITLVLNSGFEARAPQGAQLCRRCGVRAHHVLLLKYPGSEHSKNYVRVGRLAKLLLNDPTKYREEWVFEDAAIRTYLAALDPKHDLVVCDITGLSRVVMIKLLSMLYQRQLPFLLIYTEARSYYPTKTYFGRFLRRKDSSDAFAALARYEDAEVVYSPSCTVEPIPMLPGRFFPNHPLLLMGFLTFKRSRLSAVLSEYETSERILIKGTPVRSDLMWRDRALEIINFDIFDEYKDRIFSLPTLDWFATYDFLTTMYKEKQRQYRYNVLLAPLGGKMQTLGAWYFATRNRDVKVVTSTPKELFSTRYSSGYTETHLIDFREYVVRENEE